MDRLMDRQGLNDRNRTGTGSDRNNIKRERERGTGIDKALKPADSGT